MPRVSALRGGRAIRRAGGRQAATRRPPEAHTRRRRLVDELSGPDAFAALRLDLLRTLDQFGPWSAAEIPRDWPLTRKHIRWAIRSLADDGLLEVDNESVTRTLRLTQLGRRVLDEIDWTETVRTMERDGELSYAR